MNRKKDCGFSKRTAVMKTEKDSVETVVTSCRVEWWNYFLDPFDNASEIRFVFPMKKPDHPWLRGNREIVLTPVEKGDASLWVNLN